MDESASPSLNLLLAVRGRCPQRSRAQVGRPASGLRAAASCVHFLKLPVSLLSPCQDPAAASISDGDCDAREGESVAMNYKPSPLQVKLGEWVWGVRERRGMDQMLWAGSATWCRKLNHLGPNGSKTQATVTQVTVTARYLISCKAKRDIPVLCRTQSSRRHL